MGSSCAFLLLLGLLSSVFSPSKASASPWPKDEVVSVEATTKLIGVYEKVIGNGNFLDYVVTISPNDGTVTTTAYIGNTYSSYANAAALDTLHSIFYWPYPAYIAAKIKTDLYTIAFGTTSSVQIFRFDNTTLSLEFDTQTNKLFGITSDAKGIGYFVYINVNNKTQPATVLRQLPDGFNPRGGFKASAYDPKSSTYYFIFFAPSVGTTGTQLGMIQTSTGQLRLQQLSCGSIVNLEYDTTKGLLYAVVQAASSGGLDIQLVDVSTGQCSPFVKFDQSVGLLNDVALSSSTQQMALLQDDGLFLLNITSKTFHNLQLRPDIHHNLEIVRYWN
jgi:hypothetical protein